MGDGSGDLQAVWHTFVGNKVIGSSAIIDVGAGIGLSKQRLMEGNNFVITQDINTDRRGVVDLVAPLERIGMKYNFATSFDVIEHTVDPELFVVLMWKVARKGIFLTTPNYHKVPKEWHYKPEEFMKIIDKAEASIKRYNYRRRYFARFKGSDYDYCAEVDYKMFSSKEPYALGIFSEVCNHAL